MPAASDPDRRPPLAAAVAAVLSLPASLLVLLLGNAALSIAATRDSSGTAGWLVLLLTFGWVIALLLGAGRLLLGRAWLGFAVSAGLLAVLAVVSAVTAGLGGDNAGVIGIALASGAGAAVCASLPGVRAWVARRRRERLFPGSTQRSPSRP
jgi:hypothetical protein